MIRASEYIIFISMYYKFTTLGTITACKLSTELADSDQIPKFSNYRVWPMKLIRNEDVGAKIACGRVTGNNFIIISECLVCKIILPQKISDIK